MRIVFDGRMIGWTGIGRYTINLLRELQKLDQQNQYVVLLQQKDWGKFSPTSKNFKKAAANIEPYSLANQTRLPSLIKKLRPDLVHFPHFTVPLAYNDPFVVSIHDLTLVDFRNVRGGVLKSLLYTGKQTAMKQVLRHALSASRTILASTNHGADQLKRRYKIKGDKIAVVYLAGTEKVDHRAVPVSVKRPFIMYTGNYYPYKNLDTLVRAYKKVLGNHPDLQLVLGGPDDYFKEKLKKTVDRLKIEDSVRFTGFVDYEELVALYKNAEAFVFPSLSEGFGLPPLEAMAQGTPVLSSDASCMPEVLGDAAIYFEPKNVDDLAAEMDALLNSPDEQQRLRRLGPKQAAKYSWHTTAVQTLAEYKQALKKPSR